MADSIPVLVVGAGPSGLVSALWLAQNGIKVRIIDREDTFHVGSRGFGIQPRTNELFQILGVNDDVQKLATPIPTMRAYAIPGGTIPVKTWDLYEKTGMWPDRPYANGTCLSQAVLEEILRQRLSKHGVQVELSKGLISFVQDEDAVTATVAVHTGGQATNVTEKIVAKYLIGCDGARGSTRKLLGLTFQGETRDTDGMVWGDVEIKNLGSDYWHVWAKPGHFTVMARASSPISRTFHIGITGQNFDPVDLNVPKNAEAFIRRETGRDDLEFGHWSWLSYFKPNMRMVNKFQDGRVFVVGDSAHVHSPSGGQGMNCSVQDASNLAWKLALVLKSMALPSLLQSYNEERLPVITQMLHATSALYTHLVAKEKTAAVPEFKEAVEAQEDSKKSGFLRWRNTALELYGINYRFSSIIIEGRDPNAPSWDAEDVRARAYAGYEGKGALCAGDRAPEAPGLLYREDRAQTSLLKIFKPSLHTVLIFSAPTPAVEDITALVAKYPKEVIQTFIISRLNDSSHSNVATLIDVEAHAHTAYRVVGNGITVVIVRPDAFIGAIVKDTAALDSYFKKIFV